MTDSTLELVVIGITPVQPTDESTFSQALGKLSITAYDVSVENTSVGVPVGKASGLQPVPELNTILPLSSTPKDGSGNTPTLENSIFQNWSQQKDSKGEPIGDIIPQSVGTALVVINPQLGRSSLNLRLEYCLDNALVESTFEYNASVLTMAVTSQQTDYMNKSPATYFSMPLQKPAAQAVTLNSDGSPPDFDKLVAAIDNALSQDMSKDDKYRKPLAKRDDPLTAAQSAEIASVIAWNRALYPVPQPSADINSMYTTTSDTKPNSDTDNARRQFESDLQTYHTTHDGQATQLANYVFAASAAVKCEAMSSGTCVTPYLAGITFPIETIPPARREKIPQARRETIPPARLRLHTPQLCYSTRTASRRRNLASRFRPRTSMLWAPSIRCKSLWTSGSAPPSTRRRTNCRPTFSRALMRGAWLRKWLLSLRRMTVRHPRLPVAGRERQVKGTRRLHAQTLSRTLWSKSIHTKLRGGWLPWAQLLAQWWT